MLGIEAGDRPEKPADFDLMSWFDLGPMRPDEYYRQDAERWTEAVRLRNTIDAQRQRARDEFNARKQVSGDGA